MSNQAGYEVVQGRTGWVLRRLGLAPLVEFPTRRQAVRAGLAVCQDEGLAELVVRRADGQVEVVQSLDALEA